MGRGSSARQHLRRGRGRVMNNRAIRNTTSNSVLLWRGWPHRQGFWRRMEGEATAGEGFGYHPAPCFLHTHQGAALRVAPLSFARPVRVLSVTASKTKCGPGAKRRNLPFKENNPLKGIVTFKGNAGNVCFPLKESVPLKNIRMRACHSIRNSFSRITKCKRGVLVAPLSRNTPVRECPRCN